MFQGSIVALVTPMDEQARVDHSALRGLLSFHLDNGSQGVVIAGTTGESATVSGDEFRAMMSIAVDAVGGRMPVIAGTGSADTAKTIQRTGEAAELGADAALVVTPYYNRPMQSGLQAHFAAVADASPIPVILYNVPGRTAVDLLPETTASLSAHPNIVAIKEAVGERARVRALLDSCEEGFVVLSGDDPSCAMAMAEGAQGVISVAANVAPAHLAQLCEAALAGDSNETSRRDADLQTLYTQLAVETNPIPVKWAVCSMGLIGPGIRLPLLPLEEHRRPAMKACLEQLGLLPPKKI